ncbi:MAG TPA: hypothetical protein VG820_00360 [Fimbriimonadaceae bacterium]|nr:hypothetical protein [Fimbriimonadaceae bacterium]
MLFIKRPAVIVEDPAAQAEAERRAEERGQVTGAAAILGIIAVAVALGAIGYFAWWAPVHGADAQTKQPQVVHDTRIIEKPVPSTPPTIINNPPPQPPVVIERDHTNQTDKSGSDDSGTSDTSGSGSSGDNGSGTNNSSGQTGSTTG